MKHGPLTLSKAGYLPEAGNPRQRVWTEAWHFTEKAISELQSEVKAVGGYLLVIMVANRLDVAARRGRIGSRSETARQQA